MTKYWVCESCLPEEIEELSIGSLLREVSCVVCGDFNDPSNMKCVRKLPERLEKELIRQGRMIELKVKV